MPAGDAAIGYDARLSETAIQAVLQTTQLDHERRITASEADRKALWEDMLHRNEKILEKLDRLTGYVTKDDFQRAMDAMRNRFKELDEKFTTVKDNQLPQWAVSGTVGLVISVVVIIAQHFWH